MHLRKLYDNVMQRLGLRPATPDPSVQFVRFQPEHLVVWDQEQVAVETDYCWSLLCSPPRCFELKSRCRNHYIHRTA